jgi:hypothetical protein
MKAKYLVVVFAAVFAVWNCEAQRTLSDLVEEANAGWMMGTWKGSTEDGEAFTLSFDWDLGKRVIALHGKSEEVEFKGFSVLEPGSDEVSYVGFDSRGTVSRGKWGMENEDLVLRVESRTEEGTWKMAAVFTASAGGGLTLKLHRMDDWGGLISPEQTILRFKKS